MDIGHEHSRHFDYNELLEHIQTPFPFNLKGIIKVRPYTYDKNVDCCMWCGNMDVKANMIKVKPGYYMHECCIEFKEELYKNMKTWKDQPH